MNMGVSHTLLYMYTSFTYTVSYSHIHANVHIDIDTHLHLSIRIRLPTRIHGHQNPKDFDFVLPGCPAWLSCCGNSSCLRGPAVPNFARRISGRGQWHFKPSGSWISRKRWWESSVKCFRRGFGMIWTLKRSEIASRSQPPRTSCTGWQSESSSWPKMKLVEFMCPIGEPFGAKDGLNPCEMRNENSHCPSW